MRYSWTHTDTDGVPTVTLRDAGGPHKLEAVVAPTLGGNLVALKWDGVELLHRGGDMSPAPDGAWDGKAPLLWPAVGRQRDATYAWHGQRSDWQGFGHTHTQGTSPLSPQAPNAAARFR